MRVLFIVLFCFVLVNPLFGANSQSSGATYEYATVDTDPSTNGYFTNTVIPKVVRKKSQFGQIWFSVGGSGTMTVTLQFKRADIDTAWTDYDTYTSNVFKELNEGGANVQWRAIVKDDDYTTGTKIFGFSW